jgi:Uncharacterized protein conserved in bacteria (DUF2252)
VVGVGSPGTRAWVILMMGLDRQDPLFLQAASDILLGWLPALGLDRRKRDFYVRQLWDGKRSVEVDTLPPEGLAIYGRVCGRTLARAMPARATGSPFLPTSERASASIRRSPSSLRLLRHPPGPPNGWAGLP